MRKKNRVLFLWMGDPWGRLFKAVKEAKPDKIYVVIESRDPKWKEYQEEGMQKLKKRLGETYVDSIKQIKFEENVEEKEFLGRIIAKLCQLVREIKESFELSEVLWDITGAPVNVKLMVPLVAALLSSERCELAAQYVKGKEINDPILHAPESSDYRKKHVNDLEGISQKSLAYFREREAKDLGESIHIFNFPRFKFDLFEESTEALAQQILFLKIPESKSDMKSTEVIKQEFSQREKKVLVKAAMERKQKAKKNKMDTEHSINIWVSTTIQKFGKTGLVEHNRPGRHIYAKRTYCGDFFVPAVKDLMNELLLKYHTIKS
jgi:hypothetical protein